VILSSLFWAVRVTNTMGGFTDDRPLAMEDLPRGNQAGEEEAGGIDFVGECGVATLIPDIHR